MNAISGNFAAILIGGRGSRFCDTNLKQFHSLYDKEIVFYSIENFLKNKNVDRVIVVINRLDECFFIKNIINKYFLQEFLDKKIFYCYGGERRIDSTNNVIQFIKNNFVHGECKNILIHDGCRPLFSQDLINNLIKKIESYDCVLPLLRIQESIKYVESEEVKSRNRDFFYLAQTPQICRFDAIAECLSKLSYISNDDFLLNDESGFMERNGYKVSFIAGERQNIKITTQEDLRLAEFFLSRMKNSLESNLSAIDA